MPDMLVNLLRLPPVDEALEELRAAGVVVRRAQPWELTPVREFVTEHFKRAWADEISGGLVRQPVTVFVARAGLDQIPTMNDSIDRFIREAVARNAPLTVYNHPTGIHGFDNQNPDARSREIVRAALDFMRTHLGLNELK